MPADIEIEDEEAVRLIRLLAESLGVTEEEAVAIAVTERLERLKISDADKAGAS